MPTTNVSDVIKEAVDQKKQTAADAAGSKTSNPLSKGYDELKRTTKLYLGSAIADGMNEILAGDFSGIEEELEVAVDDFSEAIAHPKSSDLAIAPSSRSFFALKPAK